MVRFSTNRHRKAYLKLEMKLNLLYKIQDVLI